MPKVKKGIVLKEKILTVFPGLLIFIAVVIGDLIITPGFSDIGDQYEKVFAVDSAQSFDEQTVTVNDEVINRGDENNEARNPFEERKEYFTFIEPIAGTFFDTSQNYVFNISIATFVSPVSTNPFDTDFEMLTTIFKPIVVDETIGMKRNDLFSQMFRDKLARLLVTSFNEALVASGFDPVVFSVEIIDFWAP